MSSKPQFTIHVYADGSKSIELDSLLIANGQKGKNGMPRVIVHEETIWERFGITLEERKQMTRGEWYLHKKKILEQEKLN